MLNTPHNPDLFRRGRVIPNLLAVAALVLLVLLMWNAEPAQAKGLVGHCGIHFGQLYRIDSGGARYHARIGPRDAHRGGDMHCHGKVFIRRSGGTASVAGFPGSWKAFNWMHWNWHGILAVNGTAASCVGFGFALAGEAPSGAVDTWLTASAGAGCVGGVGYIAKTYLTSGNGGAGGNYCGRFSFTCNGPKRVKFH